MSTKNFSSAKVLPVFDLFQGKVVRAEAGNRELYLPIKSPLGDSEKPANLAKAIHNRLGFSEAYVADLEAIADAAPDWKSIEAIGRAGLRLWLDAGLKTVDQAVRLSKHPILLGEEPTTLASIVAGSETVPGLGRLQELLSVVGPKRLVFSLDLKAGSPLPTHKDWRDNSSTEILANAVKIGVKRLMILDLTQVGTNRGPSTLSLCQSLRAISSEIEIATGGGVRNIQDIQALHHAGCNTVLVASAIHTGAIQRNDLKSLKAQ